MRQITVLTESRPGVVADLTAILAERGINLESLDADGDGAHGVINLRVDRYDEALAALDAGGFRAVTEDALVIRIEDRPGALARIAVRFKEAGINIRSMHILQRGDGWALGSIVCERREEAAALVRDVLVS